MNAEGKQARSSSRVRDIGPRTFSFALRVVSVVMARPRDAAATVIARQLVRRGTIGGANVDAAEAAH